MKYFKILLLEPKWNYDPTIPFDYKLFNDFWVNKVAEWIQITNWNKKNTIFLKWSTLEDYMEHNPLIIISDKLKIEFEKNWITWVQYLPILLERVDFLNEIVEWYSVLNILSKEKSNIIDKKLSMKSPFWYAKVVLSKDKISGYDIFRIEWQDFTFYVSDKIRKIIKKHIHSVGFWEITIY